MEQNEKKNPAQIFGSFYLNDIEFALSAQAVCEVVNLPDRFTPMPLAPDYLMGIFNLRGSLIPAIDIKQVLEIPEGHLDPLARKIAIIDHDGVKLGLCFDKTGEVLRTRPEDHAKFSGCKLIDGALKLEEGKRIIQVISPSELVHLENIPYARAGRIRASRGTRRKCISFSVGASRCAFGIDAIHEIIRVPEIKSTALSGELCIGILELRGDVVPVVDFAALLGYRQKAEHGHGDDRRIVVMKIGQEKFGLLTESVESIVSYYDDELLAIPALGKKGTGIFLGCISNPDREDVILLDHKQVVSSAQIAEITRGHSQLFRTLEGASGGEAKKQASAARKTYITFSLDNLIAVGIKDIREIIEVPSELLYPPGFPKHVQGMLNLRGQIVAIVDARSLYEMRKKDSGPLSKVLVFERMGVNYGLIVDSVESIMSFADDDRISLPESLYKEQCGNLSQDIQEAVQIESENDKKTLMILDLNSLAQRVGLKQAA